MLTSVAAKILPPLNRGQLSRKQREEVRHRVSSSFIPSLLTLLLARLRFATESPLPPQKKEKEKNRFRVIIVSET